MSNRSFSLSVAALRGMQRSTFIGYRIDYRIDFWKTQQH
jgi:hypothetical protein